MTTMIESVDFLRSIVEQRDSALDICNSLQSQVAEIGFSRCHQVSDTRPTQMFSSRTTVGLTLKGSTIVGLVIGGPAFLSGKISVGDVILKVDGVPVTSNNLHELLLGTDCPGSLVTITLVKSAESVSSEDSRVGFSIELRRVRQEEIADQRSLQEMLEGLLTQTGRASNTQSELRACKELWLKMQVARAWQERELEEKLQLAKNEIVDMIKKLRLSFRKITTESSRKISELTYEVTKFEASLSESREHIRMMSNAAVLESIEHSSKSLASQMNDLGLACKGNTESVLHTLNLGLNSVNESVLEAIRCTDSSFNDSIAAIQQKVDEARHLICSEIRGPAGSVEILRTAVSVLIERMDLIMETCQSGFGSGDKRLRDLSEALRESQKLGEDTIHRLEHLSLELERTGGLVELARKPGEEAVEILQQAARDLGGKIEVGHQICRGGFGASERGVRELGEALHESKKLGEDTIRRLEHLSSELERTGELVELARKPGEEALNLLQLTAEDLAGRAKVFEDIYQNGFKSVNSGLQMIGKAVHVSQNILKDACDQIDSKVEEGMRKTDLAKKPGQDALEILRRFEKDTNISIEGLTNVCETGFKATDNVSRTCFENLLVVCQPGFESLTTMCKFGFESLNQMSKEHFDSLDQLSKTEFAGLNALVMSNFLSISQSLTSELSSLCSKSGEKLDSIRNECQSGFKLSQENTTAGFESVAMKLESLHAFSSTIFDSLDSGNKSWKSEFLLLHEASSTSFQVVGGQLRTSFESLEQSVQEEAKTIQDMIQMENRKAETNQKLELDLEEAKRELEHLRNPNDAFEKLNQSLQKEKDLRICFERELTEARLLIQKLTETKSVMDDLKTCSQNLLELLEAFRTDSDANFKLVNGNTESNYKELKSQLATHIVSLYEELNRISSIEISESRNGLSMLSAALEREFQTVRSRMVSSFEELKLQMTHVGQALDLGAAKENNQCRRLSGIQDREINFEEVSRLTLDQNQCRCLNGTQDRELHSEKTSSLRLALDQSMKDERSVEERGGESSQRISNILHEIYEIPHTSDPLIAQKNSATTASKVRSGLLDRLSSQLGHLYAEATTPDYEKMKPIQEETIQIMCNESRFLADEESKQTRTWINFLFGIGPEDAANGKEQSRLIHPFSYFNTGVTWCSWLAILYTAFFVPIQLSIWSSDNICFAYPLFTFDVFIDTWFMFEFLLRGIVGEYIDGKYVDDFGQLLAFRSLSSFKALVDIISAFPFSAVNYSLSANTCMGSDICTAKYLEWCGALATDGFQFSSWWEYVLILKGFRILKAFYVETDVMMSALGDVIDFNPMVLKMIKIYSVIALSCHFWACTYWRVKLWTSSLSDLEDFVVSKYVNFESNSEIYMMSFYFILTVFTTVGFGDIFAMNISERVGLVFKVAFCFWILWSNCFQIFCIFLFTFAASLFGTLLGQIEQVFATLNKKSRELEEHMEGYQKFFWDYRVSNIVKNKVRNWVQFQHSYDEAETRKRNVMLDPNLPDILRTRLAEKLSSGVFSQVPFIFADILDPDTRNNLSAELMLRMETIYFPADAVLARSALFATKMTALADKVMIIMEGRVEVRLPSKKFDGPLLHILKAGSIIGDSSLYGDFRWGGGYGVDADFIASTNVVVKCALCTRKEYKTLLSLFRKASDSFLSNHALFPENQDLAAAAFVELHQLELPSCEQDKLELVKMELRLRRDKFPFSKQVDNVVVYGLESFRCALCQDPAAVSCFVCKERVKGIKNEFRWVMFTRLLCIRAQSKAKHGNMFDSIMTIISNLINTWKTKKETSFPTSELENLRGINIRTPDPKGDDSLGLA